MHNIIVKNLTKYELNQFIDFQYELYRGDKNFRPELRSELWNFFTKNPFLKIAKVTYYLVLRDTTPVGRIAKIDLPDHPIMFGFFESINDDQVVKALFDEIDENRGLLGPVNFTTNDSCGLLIENLDTPCVMMPYNKVYYEKLFENYGFKKIVDLFAYYIPRITIPTEFRKKCTNIERKLKEQNIYIRTIDRKMFSEEVSKTVKVYNEVNKDNWGFLPISIEEAKFIAQKLKKITDPEYVFIAEKEGKIIGYFISLPDINEINFKNGKLTLLSILKLIVLKPKKVKGLTLGVNKQYRNLGIAECLMNKLADLMDKRNIESAEGSYVLENNRESNILMNKINGTIYKKYRIYQK